MATSLAELLRLTDAWQPRRRTVFVSHSHINKAETQYFLREFYDVCIFRHRGVGFKDDVVNSRNTDYVMSRIRHENLENSTVTFVLIGSCTHSRRYVDWEIQASLRQGADYPANGLLGVLLSSAGGRAYLPYRFKANWQSDGLGYAQVDHYPSSPEELRGWIEAAFERRDKQGSLIQNPRGSWTRNGMCKHCNVVH